MTVPAVEPLDREDEWNIDNILEKIGGFGSFQKRTYITCVLHDILVAMYILFFLFADYNPGWSCGQLPKDANATIVQTGLAADGTAIFLSTIPPMARQNVPAVGPNAEKRKRRSVWTYLTGSDDSEPKKTLSRKKRSIWSIYATEDPLQTTDPNQISGGSKRKLLEATTDSLAPTQEIQEENGNGIATDSIANAAWSTLNSREMTSTTRRPEMYQPHGHGSPTKKSGVCPANGTTCDAYVFEDVGGLTTTTEWGLLCDLEYVPILCTVLLFLGMFIGAILADVIEEKIGRKKTLMLLTFGATLFQILTGVSGVWGVYAFFRLCVGFFTGGMCRLSRVLPLEFVGVQWRSFVRFFSLFEIGYLLLLAFAYLLQNWRHLAFLTGGLMAPLLIFVFLFVPESGRWLLHQKRYSELKDLIRMAADANSKTLAPEDVKRFVKEEKKMRAITESGYKYTYIDLFSTPKFGFRTFAVMFSWFTHSLIYYTAFMLIFMEPGNIYVNILSAATSTFLALASTYPLTGKFGRKKAFAIFMVVPMSAIVVEIVFYGLGLRLRNVTIGVTILAGAYYRALDVLVGKYTNEIFPGPLRNHAVKLGCFSARFAAVLAPAVAYSGYRAIWASPFIVCFVFAVISAVLIMASWPETGKKVLTDLPPPPTAKCHKTPANIPDKAYHAGNGMGNDGLEYSEMGERNGNAGDIALDMDDAYLKTKDA